MPGHPIGATARLTGISIDTLRAWERRYDAVVPRRRGRGRVYSIEQIERLKQLAALVAQGHAIGSIASLPDAELKRLRSSGDTNPPAAAIDLAPLFRAIRQYDLAAIDALLNRHALFLPPSDFVVSVILPMLREIGARWENGAVSPAQEHLVSAIVRGVLGGLLRSMPRPSGAPLLFATPAGERHELGLLCGAVLAAADGNPVIYLGPDLPAPEIVAAARTARAKTLVLASTVTAVDAGDIRGFKKLPRHVAVLVGGARGADLTRALGSRARLVDTLDALCREIERHGT